jgi:hypothetical protein
MVAFGDMMRKQIVMPAHLMDDLQHSGRGGRNLFKDFSAVAQATGTYTGKVGAGTWGRPLLACPYYYPAPSRLASLLCLSGLANPEFPHLA